MPNGLFTPGGLMGPLQPGMPGAVNPLALMLAGAAQGNTLGGLQSIGRLQQAGARTAQTGEYQRATLAAQQEETQHAMAARANQIAGMRALAPVYARQRMNANDRERTLAPEAIASQEGQFSTDLMNMYRLSPQLAADEIKRVMAPKKEVRPPTAAERAAYGLPPDKPFRMVNGKPEGIGGGTEIKLPGAPGKLPPNWFWNPATEQAERLPGTETEPERKERLAEEGFKTAFDALDVAAQTYRGELQDRGKRIAFETAAQNFAEALAARRSAPRSPTDDDVKRAYREAVGMWELTTGSYDAKMDQMALQFGIERVVPGGGAPPVGGFSAEKQAELDDLEAEKAAEQRGPSPGYRFGRRAP